MKSGNVTKRILALILAISLCLLASPFYGSLKGAADSLGDQSLSGHSALFVGDSITNATNDNQIGWAGRVGNDNAMNWKNAGVSGASVSTIRRNNRVLTQLTDNSSTAYDYVILHGGVNDAMDNATIGLISNSFNLSEFDTSTFAGGLEELFYYAGKYFPSAKLGYIVNYATPNSTWGGSTKDMSAYFQMAKRICDKWNIPYLDLYSGSVTVNGISLSYSKDILKTDSAVNLYNQDLGEVHIGSSGYDVISPYIADWMKTLNTYQAPAGVGPDKSVLQSACDWLASEQADRYTSESWASLTTALTAAQSVLADGNATQTAADNASATLQTAANQLKLVSAGVKTLYILHSGQDTAQLTLTPADCASVDRMVFKTAVKEGYTLPVGAVSVITDGSESQTVGKTNGVFQFAVPVFSTTLTVTAKFFPVYGGVTTFGVSKRQPEGSTTSASPQDQQSGLQFGSIVYGTMNVHGVTYDRMESGTILIQGDSLGGYTEQQWYDTLNGVSGAKKLGNFAGLKKVRSTYQDNTDDYTQYAVRLYGLSEARKQSQSYTAFGYAVYTNGGQSVLRFSEPKTTAFSQSADNDLSSTSTVTSTTILTAKQAAVTYGSNESLRLYASAVSGYPHAIIKFPETQNLNSALELKFDIGFVGVFAWCSVFLLDENLGIISKEVGWNTTMSDGNTAVFSIEKFGCTAAQLSKVRGIRLVLNMEDGFNASADGSGFGSVYVDNMQIVQAKDPDLTSTAFATFASSGYETMKQSDVKYGSNEALRLYSSTKGWPLALLDFRATQDLNTATKLQFDAKFSGVYPWCLMYLYDENWQLIGKEISRNATQDWSQISVSIEDFGCTAAQLSKVKGIRFTFDFDDYFNPNFDGTGYGSVYLDNMQFVQASDPDLSGTAYFMSSALEVSKQTDVTFGSNEAVRLYSKTSGWPLVYSEFLALQNLNTVGYLQFDAKFSGVYPWCLMYLYDENWQLIGTQISRDATHDWSRISVPISDFGCTTEQLSRVRGIRFTFDFEDYFNPDADGTGYGSVYIDNMRFTN